MWLDRHEWRSAERLASQSQEVSPLKIRSKMAMRDGGPYVVGGVSAAVSGGRPNGFFSPNSVYGLGLREY
jgi:hypothetical protein